MKIDTENQTVISRERSWYPDKILKLLFFSYFGGRSRHKLKAVDIGRQFDFEFSKSDK
jgi:hypothetical protein